jgi:hypothetical protein
MHVSKPRNLLSCAVVRAPDGYASSARLSSAARGRSFHGNSGEAERSFRREAERHSGMIPKHHKRSDAGNSIVR